MKTGVFMDKSHQKSHLSMKQPLFMDKPIKNYHLSTKMPDFMDRLSKSPSCGKTGAGLGFTRYSVALRQGLE
jgi:hypothetical protein